MESLGQSQYERMQEQYTYCQEEEEEWRNDLARWKSRRRSASQDLIRKEEERKMMERNMKEEEIHAQKKKNIKTYREIVEEKEHREAELCDAYKRAASEKEAALVLHQYTLRFTISDATLDCLQPHRPTTTQEYESGTSSTQNHEFRTITTTQNPVSETTSINQFPDPGRTRTDDEPQHQEVKDPEPQHQEVKDPEPQHQEVKDPEPRHQEVKDPEPRHQEVKDPEPRHQEVKDPEPRHQEVKDPEPRHQEVKDPEPRHQEVKEPEPRHQELKDPEPRHQEVKDPEPRHQEVKDPEPRHQEVKDPEPRHQEVKDPEPQHQEVKEPEPRHQEVKDPEPRHQEVKDPEPQHQEVKEPEPCNQVNDYVGLSRRSTDLWSDSTWLSNQTYSSSVTEGLDGSSVTIESPMLNLAKRVNHWVWNPEEERSRQERWQQEQERHLQEEYLREQEKLKVEWERAQTEVEEEERKHNEEERKILEETATPFLQAAPTQISIQTESIPPAQQISASWERESSMGQRGSLDNNSQKDQPFSDKSVESVKGIYLTPVQEPTSGFVMDF
ncbi:hypothetical protein DPEC_G00179970 [Dallia pectoralis]|uniref:Uncharacterized protein n=1 Tax=Dallia pectoralis TaxID=75939 RepID=A0ACC2G9W9_DALPE|nr:hypothetical protein DPEC_G00179970 [Dallia pectoralis]